VSTTLHTARLTLVPQSVAAARALLDGTDPGLALAEGYPHADTLDGLRLTLPGAGDDDLGWFVTLADDGRVIGEAGTKGAVDALGRVEVGYGLAAPFRGRGYGTEAVQALVGHLVGQPGVREVTAEVQVGNEPSRRLLERLGFHPVDRVDAAWWFAFSGPAGPTGTSGRR
jgi:RimJ/RimL family protein N-acetyltransferase